ncbi:MAG TPA: GDSL-type esterase/lipase family protein [Candidatus Dormibacteraeota bacterium]
MYGKQVEADLGLPVRVHNLTMHNGLNSSGLLAYLQDGALIGRTSEDVLAAVTAADIVSVTIGFNDFAITDKGNTKAIEETFETNLDAILTRIGQLRAGKPTMVRVTLIYNNGIAASAALDPDGPGTGVGFWKPLVETQNAAICRISAKHKAVCVDIYHPFNGNDGKSSPAVMGYLGPDGIHPSQLGMDTIAADLVAAGYAPLR